MSYSGQERRGEHNCVQQEFLGRVKEFIEETKGFRTTLFTIALAIVVQVGAGLFMWGSMHSTVSKMSEQVWNKLTPTAEENKNNITRILAKLDNIKVIYAQGMQGEKGDKGIQGIQGIQGKND